MKPQALCLTSFIILLVVITKCLGLDNLQTEKVFLIVGGWEIQTLGAGTENINKNPLLTN